MTQVFNEAGQAIPGTVIVCGPVVVTQVKTKATDGYEAIQVGFVSKKAKQAGKPELGHIKKAKLAKDEPVAFRYLREFRLAPGKAKDFSVGQVIDLSSFAEGDKVMVSGLSKGKGFQGVVKRHGFAGGPRTHGQKHSEREPGSIGSTGPQRVMKGKRMAGRMGFDRITVKNLKIAQINQAAGELFVKGAVPGRPGTLLEIVSR